MAKIKVPDRFERVYAQGGISGMEIWVDRETGVNYLAYFNGYAGGMTILLDSEGKPVITPATGSIMECNAISTGKD